jgi:hypothetical protein
MWCLPRRADLAPDVRTAVEGLGLSDIGEPGVSAMLAEGAPVPVAPLGTIEIPLLPVAMSVPSDFGAITSLVDGAIERLVAHTRHALTARVEYFGTSTDFASWKGHYVEVSADRRTTTIHGDVYAACEFIGRRATEIMPRFISDRYEVVLSVKPLVDWAPTGASHWSSRSALPARASASRPSPKAIACGSSSRSSSQPTQRTAFG